jgi:hypothetical protein
MISYRRGRNPEYASGNVSLCSRRRRRVRDRIRLRHKTGSWKKVHNSHRCRSASRQTDA